METMKYTSLENRRPREYYCKAIGGLHFMLMQKLMPSVIIATNRGQSFALPKAIYKRAIKAEESSYHIILGQLYKRGQFTREYAA